MRPVGWETRLADAVEERRHEVWEWGRTDCMMTAVRFVDAMMGWSWGPEIVGAYDDEEGCRAHWSMWSRGSTMRDVCDHWAREHGWSPVAVEAVAHGDLAVVDVPRMDGHCAAVIGADGRPMVAFHGLIRVRPDTVVAGWGIG